MKDKTGSFASLAKRIQTGEASDEERELYFACQEEILKPFVSEKVPRILTCETYRWATDKRYAFGIYGILSPWDRVYGMDKIEECIDRFVKVEPVEVMYGFQTEEDIDKLRVPPDQLMKAMEFAQMFEVDISDKKTWITCSRKLIHISIFPMQMTIMRYEGE